MQIPLFDLAQMHWPSHQLPRAHSYICGFCGDKVSSNYGFAIQNSQNHPSLHGIYICPSCQGPSLFLPNKEQFPAPRLGNPVHEVPEDLNALYEEARKCTTIGAYTAAVLLCRKMLMNIGVHHGAKEGENFIHYVNFLADKGYVPPHGKHWVDHIRKKGNEATHAIALMIQTDAKDLITFLEMLLRFNYEFPAMIPGTLASTPIPGAKNNN